MEKVKNPLDKSILEYIQTNYNRAEGFFGKNNIEMSKDLNANIYVLRDRVLLLVKKGILSSEMNFWDINGKFYHRILRLNDAENKK